MHTPPCPFLHVQHIYMYIIHWVNLSVHENAIHLSKSCHQSWMALGRRGREEGEKEEEEEKKKEEEKEVTPDQGASRDAPQPSSPRFESLSHHVLLVSHHVTCREGI